MQFVYLLIWLACVGFAQSFAAVAQANAPAPLPPAAQEAINKGILAAKIPDYLLAIRYFEEARKLAPLAPVIYLNMGLAESRIPGRELRAMAWFGAYLAAYPDAPNAAAVKEQIGVLSVRNQSNVSRLIKSVQDVANQTPNYRSPHLLDVAALWAKVRDFPAALNSADLVQDDRINGPYKSIAQSKIAEAQADVGDIAGALKTADLVRDAEWKSKALSAIATVQAKVGIAPIQPAIPASGWLYKLDDGNITNSCPLNTAPFLDLAGYLKSLSSRPSLDLSNVPADIKALYGKRPPPDDPEEIFLKLRETALKVVGAQNVITGMLKQQAKK